jgi:CO/xanthine dehydrogenase Mo-binding subunit
MITSRRNFIKTTGCLTIGFCFGVPAGRSAVATAGGLQENPHINAWIEVLAEGRVRVLTGKMELGQGIRTAVAQVAAEELNMQMSEVDVLLAETGRTPNEGYTAGSDSIESSAMSIRYAAATARQKLLELASRKMNVPLSELNLADGKVSLQKGGSGAVTFAELLDGKQLTDEVLLTVSLKAKDKYQLVGKAIPREDIHRMVSGEPVYVQNLRFPGMLHARVVRPPSYGAKLLQVDEQAVRQNLPSLSKILVNGSFLAVMAEDEYQAIQAQQLLREHSKWSDGPPLPKVSGESLAKYLQSLPTRTQRVSGKGTMASLAGNLIWKARYSKPYIMHGSIGPSCAVAWYHESRLDVWSHSQGVYPLRESLADLLQVPAEKIHVKGVPGSGCYGHNGADDVAADAALLAMADPGRPVRVQWMREDEHAWEPYGSAMIMELEASLDTKGKISQWKYELWSDSHGARPGGEAANLLVAQYLEKPIKRQSSGFSGGAYRNAEPYYTIPNQQVDANIFKGPLRVSSLRGLGAYGNLFAIESFMDELAEKAGKDPYEFRLDHLEDERAKEVIRTLRMRVSKEELVHTGMGMAFCRYKNSGTYIAMAARVAVNKQNSSVEVQKMWAVIDAGEVINLDGIKNQIEGSMIQSASWTLQEQVRFDEKQVTSRNWDSYPIFRFSQVPEVEVTVLDRPTEQALGVGEAAQGPAAAAIANAVYRASGKRIRNLPLVTAGI